jgi:hypothetical protein
MAKTKIVEVTTAAVRIQFPHLFDPYTPPKKKNDPSYIPKYECVMLFDKSNETQMASLKVLKGLAEDATNRKWPEGKPEPFRSPFRDADKEKKTYDGYAGHIFVRASTKFEPKIINLNKDRITDPTAIYPGCWIRARVHAWPYDTESDGINIGLGNVLFVKDDEAFSGGGSDPLDDFADLTSDAPAASGDGDAGMFD